MMCAPTFTETLRSDLRYYSQLPITRHSPSSETLSDIPRVLAGEVTPDGLIAVDQVAKKL